ncbi:MAG TPA: choice-of-anchor D domain-containing protein [Terriglobales bacterium]
MRASLVRRLGPVPLALWFLYGAQAQDRADALVISPPRIEFGKQTVDSPGAPVRITVRNPSNSTIRFDQIISSGIDFPSRNDCGKELAAGAECTVEVRFKPAISGDRLGAIEIAGSDSGSPHYVPLAGTGE